MFVLCPTAVHRVWTSYSLSRCQCAFNCVVKVFLSTALIASTLQFRTTVLSFSFAPKILFTDNVLIYRWKSLLPANYNTCIGGVICMRRLLSFDFVMCGAHYTGTSIQHTCIGHTTVYLFASARFLFYVPFRSICIDTYSIYCSHSLMLKQKQ